MLLIPHLAFKNATKNPKDTTNALNQWFLSHKWERAMTEPFGAETCLKNLKTPEMASLIIYLDNNGIKGSLAHNSGKDFKLRVTNGDQISKLRELTRGAEAENNIPAPSTNIKIEPSLKYTNKHREVRSSLKDWLKSPEWEEGEISGSIPIVRALIPIMRAPILAQEHLGNEEINPSDLAALITYLDMEGIGTSIHKSGKLGQTLRITGKEDIERFENLTSVEQEQKHQAKAPPNPNNTLYEELAHQ